jgi:hypothetical protein
MEKNLDLENKTCEAVLNLLPASIRLWDITPEDVAASFLDSKRWAILQAAVKTDILSDLQDAIHENYCIMPTYDKIAACIGELREKIKRDWGTDGSEIERYEDEIIDSICDRDIEAETPLDKYIRLAGKMTFCYTVKLFRPKPLTKSSLQETLQIEKENTNFNDTLQSICQKNKENGATHYEAIKFLFNTDLGNVFTNDEEKEFREIETESPKIEIIINGARDYIDPYNGESIFKTVYLPKHTIKLPFKRHFLMLVDSRIFAAPANTNVYFNF